MNVANLLLLRAADRERDQAIRVALGRRAVKLALERLSESLAIGLLGRRRRPGPHRLAGAGAGCPESDPPLGAGARADRCSRRCALMIAIGAGISALTTILVAIVSHTRNHPGTDTSVTLAASSPVPASAAHSGRLRLLVAAQIAVAVLLLVGGGLVLRSFAALRGTDIGFRTVASPALS